jgi:hypothetical protein
LVYSSGTYNYTTTTTTTTTVAPSGIVRTYYESAYVATRTTRTGTNYINVDSMSIAGAANTRTATFWMATGDINDTTFDVRLRLSSSLAIPQLNNMEPQDTTDRMSMGGLFPYSSSTTTLWSYPTLRRRWRNY